MATWRERLAGCQEPVDVEEYAYYELRRASSDWRTCAVGEQRALHPGVVVVMLAKEGASAIPLDAELGDLGLQFHEAVTMGKVREAEQILDAIEDRVLELKREVADGEVA